MSDRSRQSPPMHWQGRRISPVGQAVMITPSAWFGFVWKCPVTVTIASNHGVRVKTGRKVTG